MLNKMSGIASLRRNAIGQMTVRAAVAASLGLAALAAGAGEAKAQQYPWCAVVNSGDSLNHYCGYTSFAECQITAEAQQGFCYRNESYPARPRARSGPWIR